MKPINKEDFTLVGQVLKPHGLKGELTISFVPQYDEWLEEADILFVEIDGGLVPFFISDEGLRFKTAESAIVQFDELDSQERARELNGCPIFLPANSIDLADSDLPLSYLNDFTVIDRTKGEIGKISQIDDYAGNIVITVLYQSKEVLIPLSDSIIDEIDEPQKILRLDVPEGLIDLYLE
jgi:16S rRNA processing protein RimM